MSNIDENLKNIVQWGHDKGIQEHETLSKMMLKFREEVIEFEIEMMMFQTMKPYNEGYKDTRIRVLNELGDVQACQIKIAEKLKSSIPEVMQMTWDKIKDRKGEIVNGIFVKEEDL